MKGEKWDRLFALPCWSADLAKDWETIRLAEADLDVKPFPISRAGLSAYNLWNVIKQRLVRGLSLELTPTELKLGWHRQRLKRARDVLVEMDLIRRTESGRYVLGRCSFMDDLAREELLTVHIGRELFLILGGLMKKSNTRKKPSPTDASQAGEHGRSHSQRPLLSWRSDETPHNPAP